MEELNLKELFNIFWSKKIQIILIVLIFIAIGVIYTIGFVNPVYTSSTTLVLATSNNTGTVNTNTTITATDISVNSKLVSTYSELIRSKNILRQVISNLGIGENEASIRNNIVVAAVKDTELIKIAVTNENPTYAAQIANEIAKVFTEKVKEIYNISNVQIVDEAEISSTPSNINHKKDVVMFTLVGIIIAIIYSLVANKLDTTVKTAEDIEKYFKVPVLASIPMYGAEQKKKKGGKR